MSHATVDPGLEVFYRAFLSSRLAFDMPEFTRVSWVSDSAKGIWGPRLKAINEAWSVIEWKSVVAGVRPCALLTVSPDCYVNQASRWLTDGLIALPLTLYGAPRSYSVTALPYDGSRSPVIRCVLGERDRVMEFSEAWGQSDDCHIGQLLGFPKCCQNFFHDVWVHEQLIDTTIPMSVRSDGADASRDSISVVQDSKANILWRWLGLRFVPHLPCSFSCGDSIEFAERMERVGKDLDYADEMDWLAEILTWPVHWTALHGIAEAKTPILKFITRTDATASRFGVRYCGSGFPADVPSGLDFPFARSRLPVISSSESFRDGLSNPISNRVGPSQGFKCTEASTADSILSPQENGFQSVDAMSNAHLPVLEMVEAVKLESDRIVLDLGCGNGALLEKLCRKDPRFTAIGIDVSEPAIIKARRVLGKAHRFFVGDLFDCESILGDEDTGIALLMPGRLIEPVDRKKAVRLLRYLRDRSRVVIAYAYGDWISSYGGIGELCAHAGLNVSEKNHGNTVAILDLSSIDDAMP